MFHEEETLDHAEMHKLATSIDGALSSHFPYIQQNYEKAREAMGAILRARVSQDEASEMTVQLRQIDQQIYWDLTAANEALKRIWEAAWH